MKHCFSLLFIIIYCFAQAQITVSNNDFVPVGRTFVMAYDTTSRQPGNAGPNQLWNFSGLQSYYLDTVLIAHPDSTPFPSYFPSANVSLGSPSAIYYQYLNNNNTGFYLLGMVVVTTPPNPPSVSTFIPQSKYFQWPMNYSDSFEDSCINISIHPNIGPFGTDTSKYISHYKEQNTIDAWGKITTPLGTFDCLRQKKFQARIDSSWYYSAQSGTWSFTGIFIDTSIIYDWVSNDAGSGFILAEISYNGYANSYSGVYWMKDVIAGIKDFDNSDVISIFPNPFSNILYLEIEQSSIIELYDMKGQIVLRVNSNAGICSLNVPELPAGIYLLSVGDAGTKYPPLRRKIVRQN